MAPGIPGEPPDKDALCVLIFARQRYQVRTRGIKRGHWARPQSPARLSPRVITLRRDLLRYANYAGARTLYCRGPARTIGAQIYTAVDAAALRLFIGVFRAKETLRETGGPLF